MTGAHELDESPSLRGMSEQHYRATTNAVPGRAAGDVFTIDDSDDAAKEQIEALVAGGHAETYEPPAETTGESSEPDAIPPAGDAQSSSDASSAPSGRSGRSGAGSSSQSD